MVRVRWYCQLQLVGTEAGLTIGLGRLPASQLREADEAPIFRYVHVDEALWRPDPIVFLLAGLFHVLSVPDHRAPFDTREVDAPFIARAGPRDGRPRSESGPGERAPARAADGFGPARNRASATATPCPRRSSPADVGEGSRLRTSAFPRVRPRVCRAPAGPRGRSPGTVPVHSGSLRVESGCAVRIPAGSGSGLVGATLVATKDRHSSDRHSSDFGALAALARPQL
jgi:hypothetical protein